MIVETLTVWNQEDLHYLAEEVLVELCFYFYHYDDKGNYILSGLDRSERDEALTQAFERQLALGDRNFLDFRGNSALHQITFSEALHIPLETIKEKYLKDVLGKARSLLRKGVPLCAMVVSDEVPDSYLDDLFALRWKENLKLWAIQWDKKREDSGEKKRAESI